MPPEEIASSHAHPHGHHALSALPRCLSRSHGLRRSRSAKSLDGMSRSCMEVQSCFSPPFSCRLCLASHFPRAGSLLRLRSKLRSRLAAQLEALAGEYTDPTEPDTPLSFYVQDGKLIDRIRAHAFPRRSTPFSATVFAVAGLDRHSRLSPSTLGPRRHRCRFRRARAPCTCAPATPSIMSSTTTCAPKS